LLRGINVVRTNRISMIRLRTALEKEGFRDVATYLQSGNVVLSSRMSADRVAARVERMINKEFGLDITVLVRSQAELARVVRRDPLALLPRLRHEPAPGPQRGEKHRTARAAPSGSRGVGCGAEPRISRLEPGECQTVRHKLCRVGNAPRGALALYAAICYDGE
jgi:uncharacterized protein DUF1697